MAFSSYSYTAAEILTACKTTIVAGVVEYATALELDSFTLDESQVFYSLTPNVVRDMMYTHVTIRLDKPAPDSLGGAARLGVRVKRNLVVNLYTRLDLDPVAQDNIWYADPTLGHYLLEDSIINCFHDRFLFAEDSTTPMTQLPIHWLEGLDPPQRSDPADRSWGFSSLVFDIDYNQKLITTYNP